MERAKDIAAWIEREKQVTVIAWAQGNAQAAKDYDAFMAGLRSTTPGAIASATDRRSYARATRPERT